MKHFTFNFRWLLMGLLLCLGSSAWGQTTVTWSGSTALPGTATAVENDANITIQTSSTNTYTSPIRIYANTTVTISATNDAKILSVTYEASSTGNYVTNAKDATVSPKVTPSTSGKQVTWSYDESDNVTEFTFKPSAQTRANSIIITYITSGGGNTPTCATPTFTPAAGSYTSAQNVTISTTTTDATIYYTTDGNDPTTNSSVYFAAIPVSSNTTIKAMAVKDGMNNSAVASAAYTIVSLNHAGTENDPYTVADARTAIDANVGMTSVYATGIVSEIVTAYGTNNYNNVTFNFVDNSGDSDFLQAFRCVGDDAANVQVGDVVVISGNLTKYGSTYEFAQGCQVVSLQHPTTPTITTTATSLTGFTYVEGNGPSAAQTITIGGANLTDDCHANLDANSNFEYSFTDNDNDYFSDGGIGTNANENVAIYVRLKAGLTVGDYNGTITITSQGAETVTVPLSGSVTAPEAPNVTWDLSTNSYNEITDPDIVTWSSAYATMTNTTGTSGTSASNYLGGDSNNRTSSRFYSGNTLTISPAAGYSITSVEFEATTDGYATALKGSNWTNASATASGTTVTVTPTDGTTDISAVIGGTCGFTSVKVYYAALAPSAPVWAAFPDPIITLGEDVELTISDYVIGNPKPSITLTFTTADNLDFEFDSNDGSFIFIPSATGFFEFTFKAENSESSEEATLFVTVEAPAASIEVSETTINVAADQTTSYVIVPVTYQNFTTIDPHVQFFDADENPLTSNPNTWMLAGTSDNDMFYQIKEENTSSEPRKAYFKVFAKDDTDNFVYSDLITITQAGVVVDDNISSITEVGTSYTVRGTVVATNSKGFIIGDGTGYAYTYLNGTPTVAVGENVKISGTTGQYGHVIQFTSSATIETATSSNYNGDPQPTTITEVPDYSTGYHLSTYLEFEGTLTKSGSNYVVAVGESQIRIAYPTTDQTADLAALENKTVRVHGFFSGISGTNNPVFTVTMESVEEVVVPVTPSITLPDGYTYVMDAKAGDGELPVVCTNLAANPQLTVLFFESDGLTAATYDWITAEINANGNINGQITINTGEPRKAYFKVRGVDADNNYVYSNLVTFTQNGPSIEIKPNSWDAAVGGESKTFNIDDSGLTNPTFAVAFYESDGTTAATYDHSWVIANITSEKLEVNVNSNDGAARSAYLKVYDTVSGLYSGLFTINQAKYVLDFAELPFDFSGKKNDVATTTGLTENGLGSDYASKPYLKFDDTGDHLILKINERPGILTFDIKGNGFDQSTFKVQTSEDGTTYTDLKTYTDLNDTQNESFDNLGENVRYIKWIYTEKVYGNVALGNISLVKYVAPAPSITITPATIDAKANDPGGELTVTYENLTATSNHQIVFCDANGDAVVDGTYDWISAAFNTNGNIDGTIQPNTGDARTAYLIVTDVDADNNVVKSNLVTINQAAPAAPSIVFNPTSIDFEANGGSKAIGGDYFQCQDFDSTPNLEILFYGSDGETSATYDWLTATFNNEGKIDIYYGGNTGAARSAYFKIHAVGTSVYSNLFTVNQAAYVPVTTYSLATSITSGKHYIIVGESKGEYQAMGAQNNNNRAAVKVTGNGKTITGADGVYEFVISGPDANGYYTIYDETTSGYLYAASSSANHLKTQATNDINGKWKITFENGVASIVADGSSNRNVMQYNSGSSLFSCYASDSQSPVYLYEKDGEATPTVDVKFAASGYATYCSPQALDLTPTEDYAAWVVTEASGTTVTFTKITGAVPAETPFILYGQNFGGQTANIPTANSNAVTAVADNKLKGTLEETYVATVEGDYTNFGLSNGSFVKIQSGNIKANKAYLPILTSSLNASAVKLNIVFEDETTGISTMETITLDGDAWYDLMGRKVAQPTKGIFIHNGKKVFIK